MIKTTPDELQGIRISYSLPTPEFEFQDLPEGLAIIFVEAQALGFGLTPGSSAKSVYPALLPQVIQEVNEHIFTSVLKSTDQSYLPLMEMSVLVSALLGKVNSQKPVGAALKPSIRDYSFVPLPLMEKRLLVSALLGKVTDREIGLNSFVFHPLMEKGVLVSTLGDKARSHSLMKTGVIVSEILI